MKILILTLTFCALAAARDNNPNIPIESSYGRTSYVDPEHLLEAALYAPLREFGITDVDVDDVQHDNAAFEVELYSRDELADDFQEKLSKVLRSDLGLSDVRVKVSPENNRNNYWGRRYNNMKTTYYIYFDPSTFVDQLKPLAKNISETMHLSMEDSMWD